MKHLHPIATQLANSVFSIKGASFNSKKSCEVEGRHSCLPKVGYAQTKQTGMSVLLLN